MGGWFSKKPDKSKEIHQTAVESIGLTKEQLIDKARKEIGMDVVNCYNFALTGQSGVGKSTLINAICEYSFKDERAAKVDINECTMDIKKYIHPKTHHLVLYDLPGAGTNRHPIKGYFENKFLYAFDCLLLVMAQRVYEADLSIAKDAQDKGTPVVFVRNKSANDFDSWKDFNESDKTEEQLKKQMISETKTKIREELMKAGIKDPAIFLIDAQLKRRGKEEFEELDLLKHVRTLADARIVHTWTLAKLNEYTRGYPPSKKAWPNNAGAPQGE